MKIKLDFITNSSSVSFVSIGSWLDLADIPHDLLKAVAEEHNFDVDKALEDPYELMEYITSKSGLAHSFGSEYDDQSSVAVGIQYENMKDEETLLEFKKRVRLLIFETFHVKCNVGHIEQCWRDG